MILKYTFSDDGSSPEDDTINENDSDYFQSTINIFRIF